MIIILELHEGINPIKVVNNGDKYLFQIIVESLQKANEKYGVVIPWYIMTSDENNDQDILNKITPDIKAQVAPYSSDFKISIKRINLLFECHSYCYRYFFLFL